MKNIQLVSQYQAIESLIERTSEATQRNIELQGHWGKYLCVLAYGFLENSVKAIYGDFVRNSSSPQVARYATARLDSIRNANAQSFIQTASGFSEEWGRNLMEFLNSEGGKRKNAIDSIVNNRHWIAHGRATRISVAQVQTHLEKAIEVIDFIERQCGGN